MTSIAHQNPSIELIGIESGRGLYTALRQWANDWKQHRAAAAVRRATAEADARYWDAALADPRIMAEIVRAKTQQPS